VSLRNALCATLLLCLAGGAHAGPARERLDEFLRDLKALQADFRQVLVDDRGEDADESSGVMYLRRPGRLRWDYRRPYEQLIVADGERLWLYDTDLAQVTVRSQRQALGTTPAALLASDRPVDESFEVTELPRREDGSLWLALKPREAGGSFEAIRVGFGAEGLKAMELEDGFGQTTRLEFSAIQRNPQLDAELFRFTPPVGVDVIQDQ